jgi:gamma-carbonic anhydrase
MLRAFHDKTPRVHETAFVEESAQLIGDVELGAHSSVWFQCVLRADGDRIRIGHHPNI